MAAPFAAVTRLLRFEGRTRIVAGDFPAGGGHGLAVGEEIPKLSRARSDPGRQQQEEHASKN
jgi:hypothetical protein